jgi:hypothetical protein
LQASDPVDEVEDVRVVQVEADHLGRPPGGAAGLDGACGPVPDLEEAHQAGGAPAAREGLALGPQVGEVGAGPGAVLEEAGLPGPQVHDPALADEVVTNALDEAGVGLGATVRGLGGLDLAGDRVHVLVALRRPGDVVGVVQAGVEPLGAVGRRDLHGQHVGELVLEGLGVLLGVEVPVILAPVAPAAGQPGEDLPGVVLAATPGQPRLAEVLLGQDVRGHLGPLGRHLDALLPKNRGAVRVPDLTDTLLEGNGLEGVAPGFGESARDLHCVHMARRRQSTPSLNISWRPGPIIGRHHKMS